MFLSLGYALKSCFFCYSFTKLDTFLKNATAEAMAMTAVPQNVGRAKPPANIPTEEKKRKAAKGSHGVEMLKKVNVDGMPKLSLFFKKAEKVSS